MELKVKIETIRELIEASGVSMAALAQRMGRSQTMTSLKIHGHRPLFMDEIGAIVGAVNETGRAKVSEEQVVKLIGRRNIKVRGFAG